MKLFSFSTTALDTHSLQGALADPACGGFAAFEGWVRNHNEGYAVTRLEYEAFTELAEKEGARIVEEARRRFGVTRAACVHRIGSLGIGDVAVWVGASAAHRDEAFRACRFIIDEVKHRVPVWKKEHYENGDSGWVNCERCASAHGEEPAPSAPHAHPHIHAHASGSHHHSPASTPAPDYSRQMALKQVGAKGQEALRASSVLVVGAGGLGVPVLQYLAGAGIGRLGIVDGDVLEASNLHRQTWYALADCGKPKAALAAERIRALNPEVRVETLAVRLEPANAEQLCAAYDLVLDCSDNFTTKFLLNDLAHRLAKPVLFASVYQFEGQLQLVRGGQDSACLRCVWPEATRDGLVGNCSEAGVLGPVPGVFGSLQALEALKLLLGLPGLTANEVLIFDLLTLGTQRVRTRRVASCVAHGGAQPLAAPPAAAAADYASLSAASDAGFTLVDVREAHERLADPLPAAESLHVPMAKLLAGGGTLERDGRYLLVCATGKRSDAAVQHLQAHGFRNCRSLRGGLRALKASVA